MYNVINAHLFNNDIKHNHMTTTLMTHVTDNNMKGHRVHRVHSLDALYCSNKDINM